MDWHDVQRRIEGGEDERTALGRFRKFSEKDWLSSVCAFANTVGGLVVLGVGDDGRIDGVPMDPEEVQERITSDLQGALSAPVMARVGRHRDVAGWVHWIEVARMRGPEPLRYHGRVLVRRHRSAVEPGPAELAELYNTFGLVLTEERLIPGTGGSDIDVEVFRAFMARRGIDLEQSPAVPIDEELHRAEILGLNLDQRLEATLYGLLCFGREPQRSRLTRGCFVRASAYAGTDRGADVLSTAEARGRLDEQVRRAEDWMAILGRGESYDGLLRRDHPIVPPMALREALVNAVAHRDYAIAGSQVMLDVFTDRVEITSPGALPNHKTPASVLGGGPPRSRNEAMADFLLVQRLMERRGTGFPRIRRAMREFNGTEPRLEAEPVERWVRVTLRRTAAPHGDGPG